MPDVQPLATAETMNNQTFTGIPTPPSVALVNTAAINQRQLLRLQIASEQLASIILGNDILWTKDSDACYQNKEVMITEAVEYADLLLKKVTESAISK